MREAQQSLEASRDRFAQLYDFAPVGFITLDDKGVIREMNLTAASLFGRERSFLVDRPFSQLVAPGCSTPFFEHLYQTYGRERKGAALVHTRADRQGRQRDLRLMSVRVDHLSEAPLCLCCLTDITEERRAEEQMRLAHSVINSTPEGVMITDPELRIIEVNPAFSEITGYRRDEAIGQSPGLLKSDRHDGEFYREMWARLARTGSWAGEIWNRRKSGEIYPEWLSINEIRDSGGRLTQYVGIFSDITAQAHIQERLHRLAYYDVLTSLPNRELFNDRFTTLLQQASRNNGNLALLFLDLDHFKQVNDSQGHLVGDELLKQTAALLQHCVRESDVVARQGGDEFMVLLSPLHSADDAEQVAGKIVAEFAKPFVIEGVELFVSVSIGISLFPSDGRDIATLTKQADASMYKAKEAGRNRFHFYDTAQSERLSERILLTSHLRKAIEQRQLSIHYQPQVSPHTGQLVGVEALARWRDPVLGSVSPLRFIPVAEETGLILSLSEQLSQLAVSGWVDHFSTMVQPTPRLGINFSPVQFMQQDIQGFLSLLLEGSGMTPELLEIEITESILMQESHRVSDILNWAAREGIRIAIDDFGTGFSSLSYLTRFPIRTLKIDRSFIIDLVHSQKNQAVIHSMIGLGNEMGFDVIAEGVEDEVQLSLLKSMGCDLIQGYFYHPPATAEEILMWARQRGS